SPADTVALINAALWDRARRRALDRSDVLVRTQASSRLISRVRPISGERFIEDARVPLPLAEQILEDVIDVDVGLVCQQGIERRLPRGGMLHAELSERFRKPIE